MKIALISGSLPDMRCGIGDYTARLASELAQVPGVGVEVLTTRNDLIRRDAVLPARLQEQLSGWGMGALPRSVAVLRQLRADVVHVQYPALGYGRALGILFLPLAVRAFCRVPTMLTVHERRERRWHGRFATTFMARTSNLVVVPDPVEAEDLRRSLPSSGPPVVTTVMISTIPVRRELDRAACRARVGASPDELVIGTFGLIHPRRHLEALVDTLATLQRRSIRSRLLIIGGEAQYEPKRSAAYACRIRERIDALGLGPLVWWSGHAQPAEVSAFLQACDVSVLLYPNGASGRNTTLQTALEHGLPVVTTCGWATSESLRAEPNVSFVTAESYGPEELADAIVAAHERHASGSGGITRDSSMSKHIEQHLTLYRRRLSCH